MLKTRKGVQKRTKRTGTGKIIVQKAGKRHLLMNKSSKAKGKNKYGQVLAKCEVKRALRQLPYSG